MATIFALYGLWIGWMRLPDQLTTFTRLEAYFWSVGLLAGAGTLCAVSVSIMALLGSRFAVARHQAATAAAIQTILLAPLLGWLLLNEVAYSTTSQVIGADSIALVWRNPAATFEAAWEMGEYAIMLMRTKDRLTLDTARAAMAILFVAKINKKDKRIAELEGR